MTGSCLLVITTNQSIKMNKSSFQAPEDILNLCEEDSKNGQSKTLTCQNALQNEAFLIQRFGPTIFNKKWFYRSKNTDTETILCSTGRSSKSTFGESWSCITRAIRMLRMTANYKISWRNQRLVKIDWRH